MLASIMDKKLIVILIFTYFIYFIVSTLVVYNKPSKISDDYLMENENKSYTSNELSTDEVKLIDDPNEAGLTLLNMVESAEKSISIAYYRLEDDESTHILFSSLLNAADNGVKVRIVTDNFLNPIKVKSRETVYMMNYHENMDIKFYGSNNLLKPWTLQNRLHDKIVIIDDKLAMVSGRNIGDRYFAPAWFKGKVTYDRSVLVRNTDISNVHSVIYSLEDYFNELWTFDKTKYRLKLNLAFKRGKAENEEQRLQEKYANYKRDFPNFFYEDKYLNQGYIKTNKVTAIHNPIETRRKPAIVWHEIKNLALKSKNSILFESPYVVPTGFLMEDMKEILEVNPNTSIFTNSFYSTLNLMGSAGYSNCKKDLIDLGFNLYEYDGEDYNHSKAVIIDKDIAILGSFNLDNRSASLNTETMLVIHSEDVVDKYNENILRYAKDSFKIDKDYEYIEKPNLEPRETKGMKKFLLSILHFLVKPFIKLI